MPYPWESRKRRIAWPAIQAGDGPVQYAQRRIAWYLQDSGRTLDSLTTSELIEIAGMGREIWYTERPKKGKRNGTQSRP